MLCVCFMLEKKPVLIEGGVRVQSSTLWATNNICLSRCWNYNFISYYKYIGIFRIFFYYYCYCCISHRNNSKNYNALCALIAIIFHVFFCVFLLISGLKWNKEIKNLRKFHTFKDYYYFPFRGGLLLAFCCGENKKI